MGANAFAHESGIHQDGVIKKRETYEIMRAEDVGWAANRMVLGKHSGKNAVKQRMTELGIELESDDELHRVFEEFKILADKKHEIFDDDLVELVTETGLQKDAEKIQLESMEVCSKTNVNPTAKVSLNVDGDICDATCQGNGPIDASFKAVEKIVGNGFSLELYSVNAITSGTDAQGEVTVRLKQNGRIVNGHGSDTDIVIASVKAYINAINRFDSTDSRRHPQKHSSMI